MYSKQDLLFIVPDTPVSLQAEGNYAQKVLILMLQEPAFVNWRSFLEKLIGAAGLNLSNDTLLVALQNSEQTSIASLLKSKQPDQVLVFGIRPEQMGMYLSIEKYHPVFFSNTQFLFADSLAMLEPDKNLKMKMWTAMKTLFNIK